MPSCAIFGHTSGWFRQGGHCTSCGQTWPMKIGLTPWREIGSWYGKK